MKWADTDGDLIQTNSLPITNLTGSWQKISADVTAPPEAVYVYLTVTSSSGHVGDVVYLDDLVVGDKEE